MSKANVKTESKKTVEMSWDKAIQDAQQRIEGFKRAIKVYREAKKRGESWPGNLTGTDGESVPA